jgi:multidrug resistance protein, MATE family
MTLRAHIKETVSLALPISFGQLGHIMMGVVDSMMVGVIGAIPLAASSLVNGLFFLIMVIGIGVSMAATPLISMNKGAGKNKECGDVFSNSVVVNISFSVILMGASYSLSYLIPLINEPPEVVKEAIPFLRALSFSVIPFMVFQSYRQFLEGLSIPNPPMVIALLANILNALLNWIFIYGKLGFPSMGLYGSGISTTVSRWIMAIALVVFVHNYKRIRIYHPYVHLKFTNWALVKRLFSIGLPSGFQYFLEVAAFSFAAVMLGWMGSRQLAAHQIAINLASVSYMIILGIGYAGSIRVGQFVGEKNWINVRDAGFAAHAISFLFMLCSGILFIVFREQLASMYVKDKTVIEIASQLLIVAALFQIFDGMQATGVGILRGLTDVKIPLLVSLFTYWIIGIPVAALLGFYFNMGAFGVWLGLLLSLALLGISMVIRFHLKTKNHGWYEFHHQ